MQITQSTIQSSGHSVYRSASSETLKIEAAKMPRPPEQKGSKDEDEEMAALDSKTRMIVRALEALTGEKIDLKHFKERHGSRQAGTLQASPPILTYERMRSEESGMNLSFEGVLRTQEGADISFSLSIQWKQEFVETERIRLQNGAEMEDPLIISLDGKPPVSAEKFDFNLTSTAHQLNNLTAGSGYLVNDRNANGKADNGLELFGPKTSDGFAELAAYDDDGNGWIDSADTVFKQLYLWSPQQGDGEMVSLEQVGIGAISLSPVNIDYTQKSGIDTPLARFKEAGVAVGEKGEAYGVFSIDLAV